MKTIWKILITLSVFALFLLATVSIVLLINDVSTPSLGDTIKVIPIKGDITLEGCTSSLFGTYQCAEALKIKAELEEADDDPLIKAIVLDINSGGGGVVASGVLMEAVRDTEKPTVAYISESGASGAYYAASATDWIIADRNSITGSIGVIMTIQQYYGLYEKLGINTTVIKAGNSKDIGSPYRPMEEEEEKEFKEMVDKIYDDFVENVAVNRGMEKDEVYLLADGTIYLGFEAEENGLIDETGNLDDAIEKAKDLAGIEGEAKIEYISPEEEISLLDLFTRYENILKWVE